MTIYMNSTICSRCRTAIRQSLRTTIRARQPCSRSTTSRKASSSASTQNLEALFEKSSWSVRSLLPPASASSTESTTITPKTLHHLLRLSALPQPRSTEEESQMLSVLESQLHFVRAIREVDTVGVDPLRAIRDETTQGMHEQTIGLEQLKDELAREDVIGHARRPRRRRGIDQRKENLNPEANSWDVLGGANETAGRYFVVRTGSPAGQVQTNISQVGDTIKGFK
ncbi:hypothetical protein GGR54DRAFT_14381 [Hypoxylon sp. NC1633]|nr:hypothetical protein GGR54DRAFT_14381 [Hypoxylon sp. NC1633]